MALELAVSTIAFDGHSFALACEGIAKAGARFVEPAFVASYGHVDEKVFTTSNAKSHRLTAAGEGLGCCTLSAHVDTGAPDAVEKLRRRLDFAAEIGAVRLITNAARICDQDMFRRNLSDIADVAKATGVKVCLENPGDGQSVFADSQRISFWELELQDLQLGINLDFGNIYTASNGALSPSIDFENAIEAAQNFHLKDFAQVPGGLEACAIGAGILDYKSIISAITKLTPDATAGIELPLRVLRPNSGLPQFGPVLERDVIVRSLAQSIDFVNSAQRAQSEEQMLSKST